MSDPVLAALAEISARLSRIEVAVGLAPTPSEYTGSPPMADPDAKGMVRLQHFDQLPGALHAKLDAHRAAATAAGVIDLNNPGPRFCIEAAIETFGLSGDAAALIRRSAGIAGTWVDLGRWTYADLTSDEKLNGVTSIGPTEDAHAVIDAMVANILSNPGDQDGKFAP